MDRRIKLRHLEAFLEIARRGQLKAAADRLALTQPAISKTLRELESVVGVRLFERDRGGATLTSDGKVFLPFAESGLNALEQGFSKLADVGKTGGTRLAIGVLPSVAARLLPQAVQTIRAVAAETNITIEDGQHGALVERLREGALDMVIGRLGPPDTMHGIAFTQLYMEHVAIVVRPGHPIAGAATLDCLGGFPVIYPNQGAAIRPLVDRVMLASGIVALPRQVETVSGAFGRAMTQTSDAVWIISEGVVAHDLRAGSLVKLPIDMTLTAGPVGMMRRANEEVTPVQRVFVNAVEAAVADLPSI